MKLKPPTKSECLLLEVDLPLWKISICYEMWVVKPRDGCFCLVFRLALPLGAGTPPLVKGLLLWGMTHAEHIWSFFSISSIWIGCMWKGVDELLVSVGFNSFEFSWLLSAGCGCSGGGALLEPGAGARLFQSADWRASTVLQCNPNVT